MTSFSSRNGRSVEHCNEVVDYARGPPYADEMNAISRQWCFDDGANGNNKLDAAYKEAQILMKENGEKCPVFLFFSIGLLKGLQMLKIFKDHPQGTSILDDFDFYEEKDNARRAQKRANSESTHQATFSENLESMVCTCRAVTLLFGKFGGKHGELESVRQLGQGSLVN
nr:unnamed protein product [Digitaria exilis]